MNELFKGRINRRNFVLGLFTSIGIIFISFSIIILMGKNFDNPAINPIANLIWMVIIISFFVFNISIFVRRLHDLGHSGWRVLLNLIPYVSLIMVLYLAFREGNSKSNKYGSVPNKSVKYPADILNVNKK